MEYISIDSDENIFILPVAFSVSLIVRATTQQFLRIEKKCLKGFCKLEVDTLHKWDVSL